MAKLNDLYESEKEFEDLLDEAERNAESSWEMQFVQNIAERYEQFRMNTFLSEKQMVALRKIAEGAQW